MLSWANATNILVPNWVIEHQDEFQALSYTNDDSRMEFVLKCAQLNVELAAGAPLAAAVFTKSGSLISLGVDAEGVCGHEMTNALILASNAIGSKDLRNSSDWEFFSLAPPCLVCLGNIYSERPSRFVCSVTHQDLLSLLELPNTPMPSASWRTKLKERGIQIEEVFLREKGVEILHDFSSSLAT